MGKANSIYRLKHRKKYVDGVQVDIRATNGNSIYKTVTARQGSFIVPRRILKLAPEVIRFLDAGNELLCEDPWSGKKNYRLPDEANLTDGLIHSPRKRGPLLYEHHINRILKFIEKYGRNKDRVDLYSEVLDKLRPSLGNWSDLLETSAGVLDGDPSSIGRFNEILGSIQPKFFSGREPAVFVPDIPGFNPLEPRLCLMGSIEYQQLVSAVTLASRNSSQYETNLNQLEAGLAGLRTLERIVNSSFPRNIRISREESAFNAENAIEGYMGVLPGLNPWPPMPDPIPRPIPEDFIPEIDFCEMFRQQCIPIPSNRRIYSPDDNDNDGQYRIDSVSPQPAAVGQEVLITGVNFGPEVSFVRFPRCGGGSIQVAPTSQNETEVRAIVPSNVTDGPISLGIQLGAIAYCKNFQPIYEQGEPGTFITLTPTIDSITVNNRSTTCLVAGDVATLEWAACPPSAFVEIQIDGGAWQTVDNVGSMDYVAPFVNGERDVNVSIRASRAGQRATNNISFRIAGSRPEITIQAVEFTQGIQTFFRNDGTPNNSLPLVANKDTIVRVYLDVDRSGFNNDTIDVTGTIQINSGILNIYPINSNTPISKGPFQQSDRETTDGTLNFLVPAALCNRELTLDISVVGDWLCDPPPIAERTEIINFRDIPALPINIRRIRGRAGNAPSVQEALHNVRSAFTYLPSPMTNIMVVGGVHDISWRVRLVGGYGNGTGVWLLSQDVNAEHVISGMPIDYRIWVGLTFRFNRGIMAWPSKWTCISHAEFRRERTYSKTAHEIAHCLDFGHVRNADESCNSLALFNVHCEDSKYEGPLPDVPFRYREVASGSGSINSVISNARDLMGYASSSSRFLNPDFWLRAMDHIDDKF